MVGGGGLVLAKQVCQGEREPLKAGSSAGAAGWLGFPKALSTYSLALESGRSAKLSVSGSR